MNDHSENTDIEVVAIDLAKKSFQLHGVDANGHKVMGEKLTRNKLKLYIVIRNGLETKKLLNVVIKQFVERAGGRTDRQTEGVIAIPSSLWLRGKNHCVEVTMNVV